VRRRDVLTGGIGALVGVAASLGGYGVVREAKAEAKTPSSSSTTDAATASTIAYYESTGLAAPAIRIWQKAKPASGHLFVTPSVEGAFAPVIYDAAGSPLWIGPAGDSSTDLRVQRYRGEDVLTYWSGREYDGNGRGRGVILDSSYRHVTDVWAVGGLQADMHEFELTDRGTALLTAYPARRGDLTAVGGPVDGWFYDCHVQEVDIATGKLLLDWRMSDHLAITETYQDIGSDGKKPATPFDPFHVNAVSADTEGTLLLSARHTHTIYSIDRSSGAMRWRLGGRKSDFSLSQQAIFAWQHNARRVDATHISMFDNHVPPGGTPKASDGDSRGLVLTVDEKARTATVARQYKRAGYAGFAMGNLQTLDDGHVLVGWGMRNAATEFTASGTPIWEADGLGDNCYRAFRCAWTAQPKTVPAVHARPDSSAVRVFMSWNGATEVAAWRVAAGATASALSTVTTVTRTGFETDTTIPDAAYVQVHALDASGSVLASSLVVKPA
jgi:hypothetical protein